LFRRTNTADPPTRPDTPETWATSKLTKRVWHSSLTRTLSSRWSAPTTSWVALWSCTLTPTTWAVEGSPTAWPPDTPVPGLRAESSESCRHTAQYIRAIINIIIIIRLIYFTFLHRVLYERIIVIGIFVFARASLCILMSLQHFTRSAIYSFALYIHYIMVLCLCIRPTLYLSIYLSVIFSFFSKRFTVNTLI